MRVVNYVVFRLEVVRLLFEKELYNNNNFKRNKYICKMCRVNFKNLNESPFNIIYDNVDQRIIKILGNSL